MKICFVTNNVSYIGGQQKILTIIANGLSEAGVDVSILFTSSKEVVEKPVYSLNKKIKIFWTPETSRRKTKYIGSKIFIRLYQNLYQIKNTERAINLIFPKKEIQGFENFFNKHKFDVIIGLTPHTASIISLANINSKKIGWMHSTYDRYFESKDAAYNMENIYKATLSKLDALIVLTDAAKEKYSSEIGTLIKRIYNPLTISTASTANLKGKDILFVGRLYDKTKGLGKLIDILKSLKNKTNDFRVTIVGDGPDMDKLSKSIVDNKLSNHVFLVGSTSNIEEYYQKNSIVVVPSLVEGFGLVITEAMEFGIPIVSFSTEGPSELIENGKNGYLIENYNTEEFSEKLYMLLEDEKLRKKLGINAKKKALHFNLSEIILEWENFLGRIVE